MMRRILPLSLVLAAAVAMPAYAAPSGSPEDVVTGLATPWEVVRMPDGRTLVTERSGAVRTISAGGTLVSAPAFTDTSGVDVEKFLGLALHPDYADNGFVYLYETYNHASTALCCSRILRLIDNGTTLAFDTVILDGIGSDDSHDGGRIAFGPDEKLYVTTGDIHDPSRPRDVTNLNGKILRLEAPGDDTDGQPAAGNPFLANPDPDAKRVYSLGHRHPQGIAWDDQGRLWETEHGPSGEAHAPSGARSGHDELNLIVPGGDFGWPTGAGSIVPAGTIAPVCHSGPPPAWAPGDLAFASDGVLYASALLGQHLHFFEIQADTVSNHGRYYQGVFGRLRTTVADGESLLFTQDKSSGAALKRVGIADTPMPAGTSDCRPATTVKTPLDQGTAQQGDTSGTTLGGQTGTGQPPATDLPFPLPQPTPRSAPSFAAPLDRLLARARASLRRRGALTRLVRTGRLSVRAGGLAPGRVVLRVKARRGGRAVTVAQGSARPRSRVAFTLRVRVTPRGRAALRRARAASLLLETAYQPASGARVVRTLSLTARR
jgi:glucose/arabinose dehydrogenase